jgi:hypothetical protein
MEISLHRKWNQGNANQDSPLKRRRFIGISNPTNGMMFFRATRP